MGKKSRKKKGSNKESHQARMKERAARREEERMAAEEDERAEADDDEPPPYGGKPRPFLDGDFVRWYDPDDDNRLHRGVISSTYRVHKGVIGNGEFDLAKFRQGLYRFTPYEENAVPKMVDEQDIYTDMHFTQLRHKVGDRVLCLIGEDSDNDYGEWVEHVVLKLWPRPQADVSNQSVLSSAYPLYLCEAVEVGQAMLVYDDTPKIEIMEMPLASRFDVGDLVVFNASLASGIKLAGRYLGNGWREGKVVTVLPTIARQTGMKRSSPSYTVYMGSYECSFQHKGKVHRCYILDDTDEHIARDDPRTRLMNAIEDDCSKDHISYLVDELGIDVSPFQDMLYLKALDHASYNALWWMEENLGMEVNPQKKTNGEALLKRLASSSNIIRFMQTATAHKRSSDDESSGMRWGTIRDILLGHLQDDTRKLGFLTTLMGNGVNALEFALCPLGLGSLYSNRRNATYLDPEAFLGDVLLPPYTSWNVRLIIHRFNTFCDMDHIGSTLDYFFPPEEDVIEELFKGPEGKLQVRRYLRFCWDYRLIDVGYFDAWGKYQMKASTVKLSTDLQSILRLRAYRVIHLIVEEDPSLLLAGDAFSQTMNADRNEFIQPELWTTENDGREYDRLSLVETIVNGHRRSAYSRYSWDSKLYEYHVVVRAHMEEGEFSLAAFVEMLAANASHYEGCNNKASRIYRWKTKVISDDDNVQDQVKLLDYLVKEKGLRHPNPFFAIKVRQCSVIRWLFRNNFVSLSGVMDADFDQYIKALSELNLLTNECMENKGFLLCLATIQFDDLQTLNWLVENYSVTILGKKDMGFNVVHAAAHFGRIEIMRYLKTLLLFDTLVGEVVGDGKYKGFYASHIAVSCGHTTIADVLLARGCPKIGKNNVSISDIASKSKLAFVRQWNPDDSQLQVDINKLLKLARDKSASLNDMKDHVLQTKCMEIESWIEANCSTMEKEGKVMHSYASVIEQCIAHGKKDFCLWLCTTKILESARFAYSDASAFFKDDDDRSDPKCDGYDFLESDFFLGKFEVQSLASVKVRNYKLKPHPLMNIFPDETKEKLISDLSRMCAVGETYRVCQKEVQAVLFSRYGELRLRQLIHAICCCAEAMKKEDKPIKDQYVLVTNSGNINFEAYCRRPYDNDDAKEKQLQNLVLGQYKSSALHILLPLDGDLGMIRLCLEKSINLETSKEVSMIYLSSCLNRLDVVELLLDEASGIEFESSLGERSWYAALGAIERGRLQDMYKYLPNVSDALADPIKTKYTKLLNDGFPKRSDNSGNNEAVNLFRKSSSYFFVHGFFARYGSVEISRISRDNAANEIAIITRLGEYHRRHLLLAALWVLSRLDHRINIVDFLRGLVVLFDCLIPDGHFTSEERKTLQKITKCILEGIGNLPREQNEIWKKPFSTWVDMLSRIGIPLPTDLERRCFYGNEEGKTYYEELGDKQARVFQQFHGLKNGLAIKDLEEDICSGKIDPKACDQGGLYLVHIATAYDRLDALEWLVEKDVSLLNQLDARGRSVLEIAEASKATRTTRWIRQRRASFVIANFIRSSFWKNVARNRMATLRHGMSKMQALCRGFIVRQTTRTQVLMFVESSRLFQLVWDRCIGLVETRTDGFTTWSSFRDSIVDFVKTSDRETTNAEDVSSSSEPYDDMIETLELLDAAIENVQENSFNNVLDNPNECIATEADPSEKKVRPKLSLSSASTNDVTSCKTIQYTHHVVKWLKQGDAKYRDFFLRRITQLSRGERSRILAKRLKGSKAVTIYETYLEQKSGFRILWTEEGDTMLVWYVAKHDNVSRMVKLIDDSRTRGNRQLVSATSLKDGAKASSPISEDNGRPSSSRIVLDPFGNVPMKIYEFGAVDEVREVVQDTWTPRLKLTEEERDVVETKGTVLLLGRSGTGKTVCILSRMDHDRQVNNHDSTFTQLFVARSRRLCKYVSEMLGQAENPRNVNTNAMNMTFVTFDELLSRLENVLPKAESVRDVFLRSDRMTFQRFKTEVYSGGRGIDPLLVWACIRSFIKGSIEACTKIGSHVVDRQSFLSLEVFGSRRCRLNVDNQRPIVYEVFEKYQRHMNEYDLWDDCDRIMSLLQRLESSKTIAPNVYHEIKKSKIYVDEIQDYTQAECLLFFYLSGPGDLFFAGDPAQSVVEGVEFRFEDIRSVEYHIAKNKTALILQKPKTVNVNYRSHAGVLNTAGAILSCMFGAFPHSAKQLKEDKGVFVGPRPGVMYKVPAEKLKSAINTKLKGTVVLVHDASVSHWRRALGGYALIYGIRTAKGLEFKSVMVLGFFGELPLGVQKPWRDLLLGRANDGYQNRYPEVEGQLKLLYTAVTRSIERLLFAETEGSVAGDAFVRWITTTSMSRNKKLRESQSIPSTPLVPLASRNKVDDVENMTMTKDEWLSSGMDNAEAAEAEEDLSAAESLWDKAIYCFREAEDHDLARKARAHRASVHYQMKLPVLVGGDKEENPSPDKIASEYQSLEVEGASIVESLLCEGLVGEAKNVCLRLIPYMAEESVNHLQRKIINRL